MKKNSETERMAIFLLRRDDWSIKSVSGVSENYNLELYKYKQTVAVQIKNQRTKVNIGQIEKFLNFLSNPNSKDFTGGFIISTSGFTASVYTYLREEKLENIELAVLQGSKLVWNCEEFDIQQKKDRPDYFGIFTCKGGVGKTTIAAHLSGAFALNGYDVALVDLDKQRNLQKLLGKNVYIPASPDTSESVISVLTPNEWDENANQETKIVVCDCNPEFDANPVELIRKFDYCIIPTTLNPLGVNKNADVIKRTFNAIRKENEKANLFVLINNLYSDEERRNRLLNQVLKVQIKKLAEHDKKCHYIDPKDVAIRFSKQLLFWGFHIIDRTKPALAFRSIGGYSYPRMDFLKLIDYLEIHTDIEKPTKAKVAKLLGF